MLSVQTMELRRYAVMPFDVLGRTVRNHFSPSYPKYLLTFKLARYTDRDNE